ncbi:MAG TPA: hypothetical protein VMW18_06635 [Candidatus Binatia bacterium]|nr:hypothetical protein [Candidatus Binatia bacterium]
MLNEEEQVAPAAEQEYQLARAYTDTRRSPPRLKSLKALAWLLLILLPMGYAAIAPLVSDDLAAGWFRSWAGETIGLTHILSILFPGLTAGGDAIYGSDPVALTEFLNFASIDTLCVFGSALIVIILAGSRLRIVPRYGSPQLSFLENIAKGFPMGRGKSKKRVGGPAGGLLFALLLILFTLVPIYVFYIHPAMSDGQVFSDAHYFCAASGGYGRHSHCIRHAVNDLDQTVWKLGWMSSLAAFLLPVGLLVGFMSLIYPIWLAIGRPRS